MTTRSGPNLTQAQRHRKLKGFTLSDEAREAVAALARKRKLSQSELIEALIRREAGLPPNEGA